MSDSKTAPEAKRLRERALLFDMRKWVKAYTCDGVGCGVALKNVSRLFMSNMLFNYQLCGDCVESGNYGKPDHRPHTCSFWKHAMFRDNDEVRAESKRCTPFDPKKGWYYRPNTPELLCRYHGDALQQAGKGKEYESFSDLKQVLYQVDLTQTYRKSKHNVVFAAQDANWEDDCVIFEHCNTKELAVKWTALWNSIASIGCADGVLTMSPETNPLAHDPKGFGSVVAWMAFDEDDVAVTNRTTMALVCCGKDHPKRGQTALAILDTNGLLGISVLNMTPAQLCIRKQKAGSLLAVAEELYLNTQFGC